MTTPQHDQDNLVKVQLTGWAYGGEALGRAQNGRMIFAPFCLADEHVIGTIIEERSRWARILPQEWLQLSPDRIDARCPHFTQCGGCHYQHIPYELQAQIKAEIVREQLKRIGGLSDPKVAETVSSPLPWHYRNHMRYRVTQDGILGLMAFDGKHPFQLEQCFLPDQEGLALRSRIDLPQGSAIEQVGVRIGSHADPMIIFHGDMDKVAEVELDFPASVVWQDQQRWRVLAGEGAIHFEIMEHNFQVSPPSFFQVNSSILPSLIDQVLSALDLRPEMTFFDLYAGVGLFSAYAAQLGARVYAVDESPAASYDFEVNLRRFDDVWLYEAPVEDALPAIEVAADVVLVDPPRSGLSRVALDAILKLNPTRITYLSCDLGTYARDAKRLTAGGFQLEQVTPIDLFPQTYHIETLSSWRRA